MERLALEAGEVLKHPAGSLRWNAQRLLMSGELPSIKELGDRIDGKVAQPVAGDDEAPAIKVEWNDERRFAALKSLMERYVEPEGD